VKLFIHIAIVCSVLISTGSISSSFAGEIKVMTYNIWGLPYPIAKRIKRLKVLKKQIAKQNADLIGFQEVFLKKALEVTKQDSYPYKAYGPKSSFLHFSGGLVLLSKFPIIKTGFIKYNDCKGWDCRANKGVLFSRINMGDDLIDVYVTHLNAEGSDMGPRLSQVNQLMKYVRSQSAGNKVIFLGDFNFTDDSLLHTHMTQILGLNDSHQEYVLDNPDLSDDARNGFTNGRNTKRIDYIWTSPELLVHSIKVFMKERLYKNKALSDHHSVIAHFSY
jgi:endonuclease/exonuclease/phosphatase family metal-dependent hydrolase